MKKIISFEADKTRNLKFGMNAFVQLEKELGKPIMDLFELVLDEKGQPVLDKNGQPLSKVNIRMEDFRTIFYVGLKWEDKELTYDQVGDIMDEAIEKHGFEYISDKMGEAFNSTFGKTALPSEK